MSNVSGSSLKLPIILFLLSLCFLIFIIFLALVIVPLLFKINKYNNVITETTNTVVSNTETLNTLSNLDTGLIKFKSESEFKDYILKSANNNAGYFGSRNMMDSATVSPQTTVGAGKSAVAPERYSSTNVQVIGIDEPDIVKTDGKNLYLSQKDNYYYYSMPRIGLVAPDYMPSPMPTTKTSIYNVLPIDKISELSKIDEIGDLMISSGKLIIISRNKLTTYDVTNAQNPKKTFEYKFDDRFSYVSARLKGQELTLMLQSSYSQNYPCVLPLLTSSLGDITLRCTDIYYSNSLDSDTIFTILKFDVDKGNVKASQSIMTQSEYTSNIYMSNDNLYLTYKQPFAYSRAMVELYKAVNSNYISSQMYDNFDRILSYNISEQSKVNEIQSIYSKFSQGLDKDNLLKFENDFKNKSEEYIKKNLRKYSQSTQIVKLSNNDLSILAKGNVSGVLLNQFSLDEYNGNLRVVTTIDPRFFGFVNSNLSTENDVYVLDPKLNKIGELKGLGLTERVYSARFIGDRAYIVTFRQIDPFYVIDMSEPASPKVAGELKIPGYSGYLHQIGKDKILGVGMENNNLKLSIFDTSDPKNPKEYSKYSTSSYGSEVLQNHHAFLHDADMKLFFIPSYDGGMIFSYDQNYNIVLKKAISGYSIQRAVYVNNYMYIISQDKIIIIDQNTFEKVKEIEIKK